MTSLILSLVVSLLLTLVFELTTSLILGVRTKADLITVILANVCTNPMVVFCANITSLLKNDVINNCVIAFLEISAVLVEFALFKKKLIDYKKSPFLLSLINNVISFSLGLLFNYIV